MRRRGVHFDLLIRHRDGSLRDRGLIRFVDLDIFGDHREFLRGVKLLDLAPIHVDFSEHVALERDRSAGGTDEMAYQFIAIREDKDIGFGFGSLRLQNGNGLPYRKAGKSKEGAHRQDFHGI